MVKTNTKVNLDEIIGKLGTIVLDNIWDETINEGNRIRKINVTKLIRSLMITIMGLSSDPLNNNNTDYTDIEKEHIYNLMFVHYIQFSNLYP